MTTSSDNATHDTIVSLEHDPELMYFKWKVNVADLASNSATIVFPTGLLGAVLTNAEWTAYPLNRSLNDDGTVSIVGESAATSSAHSDRRGHGCPCHCGGKI
jgi:hypothetical protein